MGDTRFPYSPAEVAKVRAVQFGVLSRDELEVMSVLEIDSTDGLSDPKLGATVNHKRQARCATCDAGPADCPGHFGHLVLAKPIFHIGFMQTVLAVLRCVCISCSRLLANERQITEGIMSRNRTVFL